MMRKHLFVARMIFAMALSGTLSATAQQVSPKVAEKNWKKLTTIPIGKPIHVKTAQTRVTCAIQRHTADTFTCTQNGNDLVFQRTEVQSIKVVHGRWEWLTSPWFVVPAFAGAGTALAAAVPYGDVIAGGLVVVLVGFVLFVRLIAG